MQYTKLGYNRLVKGCGSHQVRCSLIVNRTVIPNFAYCHRYRQASATILTDFHPYKDICGLEIIKT